MQIMMMLMNLVGLIYLDLFQLILYYMILVIDRFIYVLLRFFIYIIHYYYYLHIMLMLNYLNNQYMHLFSLNILHFLIIFIYYFYLFLNIDHNQHGLIHIYIIIHINQHDKVIIIDNLNIFIIPMYIILYLFNIVVNFQLILLQINMMFFYINHDLDILFIIIINLYDNYVNLNILQLYSIDINNFYYLFVNIIMLVIKLIRIYLVCIKILHFRINLDFITNGYKKMLILYGLSLLYFFVF